MKLIVLDKDATREFTATVKVNVPGESEPAFFDVTYIELPRDQITVLSEAPVGQSRAALRKYAERVFPADAGMNHPPGGFPGWRVRIPRRRGDEPLTGVIPISKSECSPQTRG